MLTQMHASVNHWKISSFANGLCQQYHVMPMQYAYLCMVCQCILNDAVTLPISDAAARATFQEHAIP
jgi:hypothetical protein